MTDTPPTPSAEASPATACHACPAMALLVYRVVPYGATGRSIWDQTARDVAACGTHLQDAKTQGTVLGARALSDVTVTRTVRP